MYPQSMFGAKIRKIIINFHLKINIFTAVKYCCILHGCVFVMDPLTVRILSVRFPKLLTASAVDIVAEILVIPTKLQIAALFQKRFSNAVSS